MADDVVRINIGVSMNLVGAEKKWTEEVPRAQWDAMTAEDQAEWLEVAAQNALANEVDAWAYVEDEG